MQFTQPAAAKFQAELNAIMASRPANRREAETLVGRAFAQVVLAEGDSQKARALNVLAACERTVEWHAAQEAA